MYGPSRDKTTHEQRLPPAGTGQRHSGGEGEKGGGGEVRGTRRKREVRMGVGEWSSKSWCGSFIRRDSSSPRL